jgi:hypothetical protein
VCELHVCPESGRIPTFSFSAEGQRSWYIDYATGLTIRGSNSDIDKAFFLFP